MKKLISLLILFSLINNFQSQNKIDLAKTILNETLDTKKYNLTKQFDLDQMTGLEYHNTYKVDNFVYLNTDFKSEYPKEKPQKIKKPKEPSKLSPWFDKVFQGVLDLVNDENEDVPLK